MESRDRPSTQRARGAGVTKHAPGRDLPHVPRPRHFGEDSPKRSRARHFGDPCDEGARRIADGKGGSWPTHGVVSKGIGGEETRWRTAFRKEDGSLSNRRGSVRTEPKRPPFCLLFEDLDEPASGVFGMYPVSFIRRILPWLKCDRREIVHVCSGALPKGEGIRVDIRPEAKPDIVADGRSLPFEDGSQAALLIDPPYTEHYAKELYGTDYPRPAHLLKEAARVARHGARIGIVHYIVPNPPDGTAFVRCFGLSMGFGYPMRAVTLYERDQASLDLAARARKEAT